MAGIYTSSRNQFQRRQSDEFGNFDGVWTPRSDVPLDRHHVATMLYPQVTTSFRSSAPSGTPEEDPKQLLALSSQKVLQPLDHGHEFSTQKGNLILSHGDWEVQGRNGAYSRGPLFPFVPSGDNITGTIRKYDAPPVDLQYGTRAIKQTIPTKSAASLTQFLAELRQDLPRLPGASFLRASPTYGLANNLKSATRSSADEYLNMVFGWQPSVQDVLKLCQAIVRKDDIIKQFIRDSGQIVRRRWVFPAILETRVLYNKTDYIGLGGTWNDDGSNFALNFYPGLGYGRGIGSLTETISTRYWFAGAYTYYLAGVSSPGSVLERTAQIARKLLGVDGLTPSLMYELTPYSWLADYFGNIGDIISNGTAFSKDSLVMRYGYLMRTTNVLRTYRHSGVEFRSGATGPVTMLESFKDKQRVKATPYGFGLNPETFSTQQWAILAALGLSRGGGHVL